MTTVARVLSCIVLSLGIQGCEQLPESPTLPNTLPTATFFLTPIAPINAGQTSVRFNAAGSRDSDGQVVSYIWNFADGSGEQTSAEPVITHVFTDTGARCLNVTYGVSLTVVDDRGGRAVFSEGVTVTELPAPNALECQPR